MAKQGEMGNGDEYSLETLTVLSKTHQKYNAQHFRDIKSMIAGQNIQINKNRQTGEENRNAITGLRAWIRVVGVVNAIGSAIAGALGLK